MEGGILVELLDETQLERSLNRIAHEILERNHGAGNLGIIGIRNRGVHLAERLVNLIEKKEKTRPPMGTIDITLYRDDFKEITESPYIGGTEIPFDVDDKDIILVDDVLYTGRTVRAAVDEIIDFGRPKTIQLAVIIDRGHRELPICADYIVKQISLKDTEYVEVRVKEVDGEDRIVKVEMD
ncbi:bifunctional pyr operon transcriptional regulator/uracil phosphoribosyltransferase PyrR [bacterium]|nr:MAG: bifunctional pyr operon transcriptional regulator/uracil phosphoribosyltransferase PyrR [bacterium]